MKLRYMVLVLMGTGLILSGCGNDVNTETVKETETIVESETMETETQAEARVYTQEELKNVLNLETERYVLVNAKDVDYSKFADYDEDIITKLSVDESKIDLSKEGTYPIVYTMEIDADAMEKFLQDEEITEEESQGKTKGETTAPETEEQQEPETVKASLDSDVTVVSEEKAAELVKDKIIVLADGGKTYTATNKETKEETKETNQGKEEETEPVKTAGNNNDKGSTQKNPSGSQEKQPETQKQTQAPQQSQTQTPQQPQTQVPQQPQTQAPQQSQTQAPQQPQTQHTHTWVAQTTTVHHDAVTEQVWVQDSAAWDEPVYESHNFCNGCGQDFGSGVSDAFAIHLLSCGSGSYHAERVQTGTVHHEATGHYETKTITAAWEEPVTTGYVCSECGTTKSK